MNNDEAGKKCSEDIKARLNRQYNLHFPKFETNDIGDMSVGEVKDVLLPFINQVKKEYEGL